MTTIRVGSQDYPPEAAVAVAARRGESLHPPGTPEMPCAACGAPCPVDARTVGLVRGGMAVVCVRCAVRLYPGMVCGSVGGRPVTIEEWAAGRGAGLVPAEVRGNEGD